MLKFNVFTKIKTKNDGTTFPVRLTQNEAGISFEVRFTEDCDNKRVVPKDNKPFVLVVDEKCISLASKKVKSTDGEKTYTKRILYIRAVEDIEEYIEPEFDVDAFNSIKNAENTEEIGSGELPF